MATVTKPYTFTPATSAQSAQVNSDFDTIYTEFNGNIDNANIKSAAAIDASKIANTAATLSANETFTGQKTFTQTKQTLVTATDASTVTFNLASGQVQTVTLGGNRTLAVSNALVGEVFILRLVQDGTGSRTVTWFTNINWEDGQEPVLSTTAAAIDIFAFLCTSTGNYDCIGSVQNLS